MTTAVQEAVRRYQEAGAEEVARMRPLSDLLAHMSEPAKLRATCLALLHTRQFADFAYLHNNGFFVIYLADPDMGLQVRLHVWAPAHPPRREQPHRHRMGFVSRVLSGVLRSTLFERVAATELHGAGVVLFQEHRIDAPSHGQFDVKQTTLQPGPVVGLRPVQQCVHRAGQSYCFPASGIHCVDSGELLPQPVVTLTVWEPAFQPSVAYEPVQPVAAARTMDVRRLSSTLYDEMLQLVLGAIENPA